MHNFLKKKMNIKGNILGLFKILFFYIHFLLFFKKLVKAILKMLFFFLKSVNKCTLCLLINLNSFKAQEFFIIRQSLKYIGV